MRWSKVGHEVAGHDFLVRVNFSRRRPVARLSKVTTLQVMFEQERVPGEVARAA